MYDTARRVALVKQRVRENTRRRQRREAISLSVACILLCAVLTQAAGMVVGSGQTAALCFRLRSKEKRRNDGADKPARHEKEEKSK